MRIIDIHAHIWQDGFFSQRYPTCDESERNISDTLKIFEDWPELYKVGIMPLYGGADPDEKHIIQGNDDTEKYASALSDKLFGFFTINPYHIENAVAEIKRAAGTEYIYGIKSWIACRADRDEMITIVKACIQYDLPILIHAFYKKPETLPEESTPDHIAKLASKLPEAKIIMAHVGMDWPHGTRVIADHENVYTDFSGSLLEQGTIEKSVKYLGAERVLFGSDLPYVSFAAKIGMVKGADLTIEQKQNILFENAMKLFRLPAGKYTPNKG